MSEIDAVQAVETTWTTGVIIEKSQPMPDLVRLRLHVEERIPHRPGQHYLIRLRAPDDYTAQRSYSIASDTDDPLLEFGIERLPDGEVSEFHTVTERESLNENTIMQMIGTYRNRKPKPSITLLNSPCVLISSPPAVLCSGSAGRS